MRQDKSEAEFDLLKLVNQHINFIVLFGTLLLFLIANSLFRNDPTLSIIPSIIAAFVFIEIIYFVFREVKDGAQKHGWKNEILDTALALVVALVIWYGASFLLNTSSPISSVVSCSMLPNLQRGDFVIVQGSPISAYAIAMSRSEFQSIGDRAVISYDNKSASIDGSIFAYCLRNKNELCSLFVNSPEKVVEQKGPFTYRYASCPLSFSNGVNAIQPCLKSVTFKGVEYLTNFSNDIIVYQPSSADLYARVGDIVHRAMFKITVDGETYYITRGDNNPVLDIQVYDYGTSQGNNPAPQKNLRGRVIGRIPVLGYFKLFISGYFQEDNQCKTQLTFEHV